MRQPSVEPVSTAGSQTQLDYQVGHWALIPIFESFGSSKLTWYECQGIWDGKKLYEAFKGNVLRLAYDESCESDEASSEWDIMVIEYEPKAFLYFYYESLYVISSDLTKAQKITNKLRKKYIAPARKADPYFYLLKMGCSEVETHAVKLNVTHRLPEETLRLHYGDEFLDWDLNLQKALKEKPFGITVLQGSPGTGKTSYLKHLLASMTETHRFYFLPATHFKMLKNPEFIDFWCDQDSSYPSFKKVIVIEDAETLLAPRDEASSEEVGALLNISDGFLGDFLKMNLICTINCALEALDPAILRPGRLVAQRKFGRLTREQAQKVARKAKVKLADQSSYSIAEIYNGEASTLRELPSRNNIGFAV